MKSIWIYIKKTTIQLKYRYLDFWYADLIQNYILILINIINNTYIIHIINIV